MFLSSWLWSASSLCAYDRTPKSRCRTRLGIHLGAFAMKCLIAAILVVFHAAWGVVCPAVTIEARNHSLTIGGTQNNDHVEIMDDGGGTLRVNGTKYRNIRSLIIDSKAGNDRVTYVTANELSLSSIQIDLGPGDDVASLDLGTVESDVKSEVDGGAGRDTITTTFEAVEAGVVAESIVEGGTGDDKIGCAQHDVSGSVTCTSRGGAGHDEIVCHANNVYAGGKAGCVSDGGSGDDTITCSKANVAGFASCSSDGGAGNDDLFCNLDGMSETGSGLCHQTGGPGNDALLCQTSNINGQHVCFADGGAGDDVVTSVVKGTNATHSQCNLYGGPGDDELVSQLGTFVDPLTVKNGTVTFFADAEGGDDHFVVTANLSPESDVLLSNITVLMGKGNDIATLNYYSLGGATLGEQLYDGGQGLDAYEGTIPAMFLPLANFEIGVSE
jgi:hypothetical protein